MAMAERKMYAGPVLDLRDWLQRVAQLDDLQIVTGADWNLEIGVINELWGCEAQALLFDEIPGFPKGYRVLTNALNSPQRIALTLGLPPIADKLELVRALRERFKDVPLIPPKLVNDGPILENVLTGDEVDLLKFPTPFYHELDGGRFIGTACLSTTVDPDSGWVNFGAYRVMIHDAKSGGIYITLGKHGMMHLEKYWQAGKPCPIAISVGHDPLLFMVSGVEIPYGISEYDYAGGLRGRPVEVVKGPATGIPIPAHAEVVLEGEIWPDEVRDEGPFGEWTGYYASGTKAKPVIRLKSILHRNDPILFGAPPGKPPSDNTYYLSPFKSAAIWDEVEKAGVPGVQGVWQHEAGGGRLILIVSIRQMYPGHAKQAAHVAAQCHQGAYANRFVIVVDEDVDPTNTHDVLWAMATRADLRWGVDIIHRNWTSPIDPMHYPEDEGKDVFNSRMIIDACRPWERRNSFPQIASSGPDTRARILEKFSALFAERRGGAPLR